MTITDFRRIASARIEFDRGLNIVYGPNDLGKSTLAEAIRAAFLLPSTSSEARQFVPWGTDAEPRVVLEFETLGRHPAVRTSLNKATDDDAMDDRPESGMQPRAADASATARWRITKSFAGPRGSALLERISGHGRAIEEARGRDVDGRLRELLGWGLLAPGGKGAPRGFAGSYLTTVLLGEQDKVTAVLATSLDGDKDQSGRSLLTQALGAIGRDPLIGRLLERLAAQTTEVYTRTGQTRRTRENPLAQQAERIRLKEARVEELREQVRKGEAIELRVAELKRQECEFSERVDNTEATLNEARAIAQARNELHAASIHQQGLHEAAERLKSASEQLATASRRHSDASGAVNCSQGQLAQARETYARISEAHKQASETASERRKARRAELGAVIARLGSQLRVVEEIKRAQELLGNREQEATQTRARLECAQRQLDRARLIHDIASRIASRNGALLKIDAANSARQEREQYESAEREAVAALQAVTKSLDVAEQTLARDRDHIESRKLELQRAEDRTGSVRARLLNARALEQQARNQLEDARRLVEVEKEVADRTTSMQRLDGRLSAVEQGRADCEARSIASKAAMHRQRLVLIGGAALAAGAGISGALLADARAWLIAFGVALCAGLAVPVSRILQARSHRAALAAERDRLRDQRNELLTRRLMAEEQLASSRRSLEQARDRIPDAFPKSGSGSTESRPDVLLQQAESRWEEARQERARVEAESQAALLNHDPASVRAALEQLQGRQDDRQRQIRALKMSQSEHQDELTQVRQELSAARERGKAAGQQAANSCLDELDAEIAAQLSKHSLTATAVPEPDDALAAAQVADEAAHEAKTAWELADRRLGDARSACEEHAGAREQPLEGELESLRVRLAEFQSELEQLDTGGVADAENEHTSQQTSQAAEAVQQLEQELLRQQAALTAAGAEFRRATDDRDEARLGYERFHSQENGSDVAQRIAGLQDVLDAADPRIVELAGSLDGFERDLNRHRRELQHIAGELQRTQGQLEHVGGAVVRDELAREQEQLEQLRASAEELELEYQATRRLHERLAEADARHVEHLGRQLSGPVGERFLALTGDRYEDVLFAPDLAVSGVEARGECREPAALSVGTRDQLATLIRLAIAAHLKTTLLLDDQLAHSDMQRMNWLRDCLRDSVAANAHQIIVATCRPEHYLDNPALYGPVTEGGGVRAIDLASMMSFRRSDRSAHQQIGAGPAGAASTGFDQSTF